jgi:hypothetical protein
VYNFNRAAVRGACIVFRVHLGGQTGGLPALIHALVGLAIFVGLVAVVRGLLSGTLLGDFLDVPLAIPLTVLGALLTGFWLVRVAKLLPGHGPLLSNGVEDRYTGDPALWWSRIISGMSEWTILERTEPAVLTLLGLLLLPWTPTRGIGLVLLFAASAVMTQARLDRAANKRDDLASVIPLPPLEPDSIASVPEQTAMLPEELYDILSEDVRERLRDFREQAEANGPPPATPPNRPGPEFLQRAPDSVVIYGGPLTALLQIVVLVAANFVVGDPANLHRWAPDRWRAAVLSLEAEMAALDLVDPTGPYRLGSLTKPFVSRYQPVWRADWTRRAVERAVADTEASLRLLTEHVAVMETLASRAAGVALRDDATSDEFDVVILTANSVAHAWSELLGYAAEARAVLGDGQTAIHTARTQPTEGSIDRVLAVRASATSIAERTELYLPLIHHIGTMRELVLVDQAQRHTLEQEFDG